MTERERILTLLRGGKPDRVPWCGDLDYWATALVGRGQKPQGFQRSPQYLDWHLDLGVGFYLQGYFPFQTIIENCKVEEWKAGHKRYRRIVTPKGTLRECWQWMPDDFTEGPIEHLVKSVADLPAYRFVHANTRYEPDYGFAVGAAGAAPPDRRRRDAGLSPQEPADANGRAGFGNHGRGRNEPGRPGPAGRNHRRREDLARPGRPDRRGFPRRGPDDPREPLFRGGRAGAVRTLHEALPIRVGRGDPRRRQVLLHPPRRDSEGSAPAGMRPWD